MRALAAAVEALVAARTISDIPLLRITVVEDHSVPTLDDPILFTTHPVQRILSASGRELPFLQRITFPIETISHLPAEAAGGVSAFSRQISFALANVQYEGVTLYEHLTLTGRLDRAQLLLATLTVPNHEMGSLDRHRSFIHGDFTEGATTIFFAGIIDRVVSVGDEIQCIGKTEIPQVDWKHVPDDGSDPRDRGARLPIPMGENAVVRCVNLVTGPVSSLELRLGIGDTEAVLADASDFSSTGTAMVGAEAIDWTSKSDNTLLGVTRGELGTTEADHVLGSVVVESSAITLGVADRAISAVTGLFIRSQTTGATVKISSLIYSVDYDDQTTSPGDTGDPITSITLNATQFSVLINALLADAAVTQQPAYITDTEATTGTQKDAVPFSSSVLFDQGTGANGTWSAITTNPHWVFGAGGNQEGLRTSFTSGLSKNDLLGVRTIQFGFIIDVTAFSKPMTVGLTATGLEDQVQGFVDGSVVASFEITSTGLKTVTGTVLIAVANKDVDDFENVVIDFIKSESAAGANITLDVDEISMTYLFVNDVLIGETVTVTADSFTNETSSGDTWRGAWSGGAGSSPSQIVSGGLERLAEMNYTADPTPSPGRNLVTGLELILKSVTSSTVGTNTLTLDFTADPNEFIPTATPPAINVHSGNSSEQDTFISNSALGSRGKVLADIIGLVMTLEMVGGAESDTDSLVSVTDFEFEITYDIKDPLKTELEQVVDAQIQAGAGGIGLEFFALCDGPVAPDANYVAATDALLTNPSDLIQYWLREIGGFVIGDVDAAGTFDTVGTILAGYDWGFDARNLGGDFQNILARMGYEARSNITRPSGGKWALLAADASYEFATPTVTVDSLADLIAIGKDDSEIRTRLLINFGFDPRQNEATSDDFVKVQTTVPADAAVVDREEEFGRIDDDPRFLFCHSLSGDTGVTEWRKYMEQELGREGRLISARVDWWQGYALEVGDVVNLSHPKLGPSVVKSRVIETTRSQQQGILVRFVEVL